RPVGSQLVTLDVAGAGNVPNAAEPASRSGKPAAPSKRPLTPQAGRGSGGEAAAEPGRKAASVVSGTAKKGNGRGAVIPLSRTAGEDAKRREAGEGVARERQPSPSHRSAMGPSLSRNAGEGL